MSRRRKKNTLLPKMIGIAVVINAIILPILARLGVFKAIHEQVNIPVELVKAPPPAPKPKSIARKKQIAQQHHGAPKRTASRAEKSQPSLSHPNLMASKPAAGGTGSDSGINPAGTGKPGVLGTVTSPPIAAPTPAPPPTVLAPPVQAVAPVPPPQPPKPTVATAPPVHVPVIVVAAVVSEPKPVIPDDYSSGTTPSAFRALFKVHPDGSATVSKLASSGDPQLDALAMDAAKKWTFKPATEDGKPVESYLRLTIDFELQSS